MKKYIIILNLFSLYSFAEISDFYGSIGASYEDQKRTSKTYSNKESEIKNYFQLGYRDYIYSPNLLNYNILGKLEINKRNASGTDNKQNYEYDAKLNFFQRTYFPFKIKAEKILNDVVIANSIASSRTQEDRTNFGIEGKYKVDTFWLDYNVDISDIDKESSFSKILQNSKKFSIKTGDKFYLNDASLTLNHSLLDSTYDDRLSNSTTVTNNEITDIELSLKSEVSKLSLKYAINDFESDNTAEGSFDYIEDVYSAYYNYDIYENLSLNANFETTINDEYNSKVLSSFVGSNWEPNTKTNINTNLSYNTIEQEDNSINLLNFDFNSNYAYGKDLSFDAYVNAFALSTNKNTGSNYLSGVLGANYKKSFNDKYKYNVYVKTETSTNKYEDPSEMDVTSFKYSINNNLAVHFTKDTRLQFNLDYSDAYTSLSENDNRINFRAEFISKLFDKINYNFSTEYDYQNNKFYSNDSSNLQMYKYSALITNFNTNSNFQLTPRSNASINFTATYKQDILPDPKESLVISSNLSLNYRIFSTLFYTMNSAIRSDNLEYNIVDYSMSNILNYTIRRFNIKLKHDYWTRSSTKTGNEEEFKTMLQLTRTF